MSCEVYTPYVGDAVILLLMKGKLTVGKVKYADRSTTVQILENVLVETFLFIVYVK